MSPLTAHGASFGSPEAAKARNHPLELAAGLLCSGKENFAEKAMLRIQRSENGNVIFTLSGRIDAEYVEELERLFSLETGNRLLVLDLRDVTLVDRDTVKYLTRLEAKGVELENCPAYIREWIQRERDPRTREIGKRSRKYSMPTRRH